VNSPNENGDIESSNGGLKHSVEQHLGLRGSRDFTDLTDYEAFLGRLMDKRNAWVQFSLGASWRRLSTKDQRHGS
jgi:hypothetical protein